MGDLCVALRPTAARSSRLSPDSRHLIPTHGAWTTRYLRWPVAHVAALAWSTEEGWALHGTTFRWISVLAAVLASTWLPGTLRLASRREFLRAYPLELVAPTDFAERMPQWVGNLWMGKCYDWTARHTQLDLMLTRRFAERRLQ
jgi:hypothetical protein